MFPKNPDGKRFNAWPALDDYGIELLTGEACGIGLRLLFDVSPEGAKILEEFLSIRFTDENNAWNHQGQEGWKSIMLSRGVIDDLLVFIMCREYPVVVKVNWRSASGYAWYVEGFPSMELYKEWRKAAERVYISTDERGEEKSCWMTYYPAGTGAGGTRNTHFMSGRTT